MACLYIYSPFADIAGDEDGGDRFLQYAISQSMLESREGGGTEEMDIYEALRAPARSDSCLEIQRAIEASLSCTNSTSPNNNNTEDNALILPPPSPPLDNDLQLAIALSEKEQDADRRREREEQETLERILALSLTEQ
eukprot:TRINITY_DN5534_c0_g1_i2.p1 TRINITY_DN5534_c0_g1~~TRINITY_DN5534_c0_g1_i2.p1  ORF type:complete len:138 (+),score=44.99 TRINITY_DN5534_c0_g1_i2:267-680(+)